MAVKRISYDRAEMYIGDETTVIESPSEATDSTVDNMILKQLLDDNLTNKQKCYIMLYYRDGLTMEEIASCFGVAKSTVSRTIFRGRERLFRGTQRAALRRLLNSGK